MSTQRFACSLLWLVLAAGAFGQTWADGTPITRFDKRQPAAELVTVEDWAGMVEHAWAGPHFFCNRLQDWTTVADEHFGGALACRPAGREPLRAAHLLPYDLGEVAGPFRLDVLLRAPGGATAGFAGFLLGAGAGGLDYRGAAQVHHFPGKGGGLLAVVETSGSGALAFREMSRPEARLEYPSVPGQTEHANSEVRFEYHQLQLNLEGLPASDGSYTLRLTLWARHSAELLGAQELTGVPAARLRGNVALVSHVAGSSVEHRFGQFRVGGERLAAHPERRFGPVVGALYAISGGTLKLGAQFVNLGEARLPPVGGPRNLRRPSMTCRLEARPLGAGNDAWRTVDRERAISPPSYYVLFRVEGWDTSRDWETRVVFTDERGATHTYRNLIRRDPVDQPTVSVAGFTGMGAMGRTANAAGPGQSPAGEAVLGRWTKANVWLPFEDAVNAVAEHNPDILFFTGDQIYEGKPTARDGSRSPFNDYLHKWLLWHWSFAPITFDRPTFCQPDDHDVYHGNLWGWGGRLNLTGENSGGGYLCSPEFVNLVHRTQAGHHPDAWDPRPSQDGISHYYSSAAWGGVGFAVLEDRKFKCPGSVDDPAEQTLLGPEQLAFLEHWATDWAHQTFKLVVSQTIYAGLHVNLNDGALSADRDTNAWPKVGRDRAVEAFRRCGAVVLSGDQHLSTFARIGLANPHDGPLQFCVPALANIFWRWFYPAEAGGNRAEGEAEHLGEFIDAWGNPFRMLAVANPERADLMGQVQRQRNTIPVGEAGEVGDDGHGVTVAGRSERTCLGDGYGIIRFDKPTRAVTFECWPHNVSPATGRQFPGWPQTFGRAELAGQPAAWLPTLTISGCDDALVVVCDEATGAVVKATRAGGPTYAPGLHQTTGSYRVQVRNPETGTASAWLEGLRPTATPTGALAVTVP